MNFNFLKGDLTYYTNEVKDLKLENKCLRNELEGLRGKEIENEGLKSLLKET